MLSTKQAGATRHPEEHRAYRRALFATFPLALALRLLHLWALARTPFWDAPVVDARGFADDAEVLLAQGGLGHAFYRPPLYAYVRAGLTWVGLGDPTSLHVMHAVISAVTATLLVAFTHRLCVRQTPRFRSRATWAACAIAAGYGPLVLTELELLAVAWVDTLLGLALLLASNESPRPTYRDVAAGLCVGLATTGWGHAIVFVLPVLLLRMRPLTPTKRAHLAAMLLLVAAGPPALCAFANAREGEPGIVISANVGINLWLGNTPRFRETAGAGPGAYYDREYQLPTRAGALTMRARERWYLAGVVEQVRDAPLSALGRTGEKLWHLVHGGEIGRDQSVAWLRAQSPIAALLVWDLGLKFPFGLLLPFALLARREALRPGAWAALVLTAAAYVVSLAPFIVSMRYRSPLVLLLVPLAASACADLPILWPGSRAKLRVLARSRRTWIFALALVVCNVDNPTGAAMAVTPAQQQLRLSRAYQRRGQAASALDCAERAVELAPHAADAHDELGVLLLSLGRPEAARARFARALALLPDSESALIHHAHALLAMRALKSARESLHRATVINPYHAFALGELARVEYWLNNVPSAAELLERSLAASYRREFETVYQLARLYLQLGQIVQARELLVELAHERPESRALDEVLDRLARERP